MKNEIWREIPGYEGRYEASNMGRIRSMYHYVINRYGSKTLRKGRILKQQLIGMVSKYYAVYIWDYEQNKQVWKYVHYLVALTFPEICGEYFDGAVCNHKDENKLNNKAENIEFCTISHNSTWGTCRERISAKLKVKMNKKMEEMGCNTREEYKKRYRHEYYMKNREKYIERALNRYYNNRKLVN